MSVMLPAPINPWQQLASQYGQGQLDIIQAQKVKQQQDLQQLFQQMQIQKMIQDAKTAQEEQTLLNQPFYRNVTKQIPSPEYGEGEIIPVTGQEPVNLKLLKLLGKDLAPLVFPGLGPRKYQSIGSGGLAELPLSGESGPPRIVAQATPKTPKTIPSAGNAVDLAIKRKFGSDFLQDSEKSKTADLWLDSLEGREAVKQARDDLTPPAITFLQTSEGFVPVQTRGEGAGTIGKPTELRKPVSDAQLAKVGELNAILENIDRTKELYRYGTGKEHTEWVGPIGGRAGGIEAKYFGTASSDQVKFYAYVKDMQDALLRARSGAQINEQEYKRLVAFLPEPNLPPVTFKAKLERFEEATQILMDEKLKAFEKGGFGVKGLSGIKGTTLPKGKTMTLSNGKTIIVED